MKIIMDLPEGLEPEDAADLRAAVSAWARKRIATRNAVHSTSAEKKGACPIPRYVLRGMLIQRGTSLAEWARLRGVRDSTVHNALVGRRTGAKSRRLAAELLEELGL